MKRRIFLDTNIVIDYLSRRMPFAEEAMSLFSLSPRYNQLCISSLSFTTIYYVLKKHFKREELLEMLEGIQMLTEVLPTDDEIINQAIHSDFKDFEDAVQYYTAEFGQTDCIITRNPKDYIKSNIPVYTPAEFLQIPHWTDMDSSKTLNEPQVVYKTNKS